MWVDVQRVLHLFKPDLGEEFADALLRARAAQSPGSVGPEHLAQLSADLQRRVQRARRILGHVRDARAAQGAERRAWLEEIAAIEHHATSTDRQASARVTHQRQRERGLS